MCGIIWAMKESDAQTDVMRLLPLMAGLWLGYVLILLLIDHLFYPRPVFPPPYYLINGANALIVLGLSLWPQGRKWLGGAFLLLVIGLLSVVPTIVANVVVLPAPHIQASSPESIMLRQTPLLLMALILTAWQYGWRYVVFFSVGIGMFTLGLHLCFFNPGGASITPPVTVVLIQTVSFLVVGYFISVLIRRLEQQRASLVRANAQLTDYAAALEDLTISRERNRMARELHDTLAHTLSALSVQLETVKAYWDVDPAAAQGMLDRSLQATRSGLQETRRALKSLRASPLDDLGLVLALRSLAEEAAARAGVRLDLSLPEAPLALDAGVEHAIYRVAQEALANAAHHANAQTLALRLAVDHTGVSLRVQDDGLGFTQAQAEAAGHFGLPGMRERAQLVGGELSVDSQPGRGTTVELRVALCE
ncbi:MAG: sensor histidine kinase [Anaerolineae bacterium]|nr:sensor histidine kinase [Anaerolineae bacterium]